MSSGYDSGYVSSQGGIAWAKQFAQSLDVDGINRQIKGYTTIQNQVDQIVNFLTTLSTDIEGVWTGQAAEAATAKIREVIRYATAATETVDTTKKALADAVAAAQTARTQIVALPDEVPLAAAALSPFATLEVQNQVTLVKCATYLDALDTAYAASQTQLSAVADQAPHPASRHSTSQTGSRPAASPITGVQAAPTLTHTSSAPAASYTATSTPGAPTPPNAQPLGLVSSTSLAGTTAPATPVSPFPASVASADSSAQAPLSPNFGIGSGSQIPPMASPLATPWRSEGPATSTPNPIQSQHGRVSESEPASPSRGNRSNASPALARDAPGNSTSSSRRQGSRRSRYAASAEPEEGEEGWEDAWTSPAVGGDETLLPLTYTDQPAMRVASAINDNFAIPTSIAQPEDAQAQPWTPPVIGGDETLLPFDRKRRQRRVTSVYDTSEIDQHERPPRSD